MKKNIKPNLPHRDYQQFVSQIRRRPDPWPLKDRLILLARDESLASTQTPWLESSSPGGQVLISHSRSKLLHKLAKMSTNFASKSGNVLKTIELSSTLFVNTNKQYFCMKYCLPIREQYMSFLQLDK